MATDGRGRPVPASDDHSRAVAVGDAFLTRGLSELKPKRFNVAKLLAGLFEHWRSIHGRDGTPERVALYLGDAEFSDYRNIRMPKGIAVGRVFGLTEESPFDMLGAGFDGFTALAFLGTAHAEERTSYFRGLARTIDVLEPESFRLFRDQWYRPDPMAPFYRACEANLVHQEKVGKLAPFELARRSERHADYNYEVEAGGASGGRPMRDGYALGCMSVAEGMPSPARAHDWVRFDHDLRPEDKTAPFFLGFPRFLAQAAPRLAAAAAGGVDLWLACPYPDLAAALALAFKNDPAWGVRDVHYPALRWGWHPMAELAGFLAHAKPRGLYVSFDGRQRISVVAKQPKGATP